jgi:hypothetical protein
MGFYQFIGFAAAFVLVNLGGSFNHVIICNAGVRYGEFGSSTDICFGGDTQPGIGG